MGNHVIIGRGKKCYKHSGNLKFRETVQSRLAEYSLAHSKSSKSMILMDTVRSVHRTGGFIKMDSSTGRWMTVGTFLAREKTSQTFRDILSDGYKSSKAAKKKRRQAQVATSAPPMETTQSLKRRRYETTTPEEDEEEMDVLSFLLEDDTLCTSSEMAEPLPYDADSKYFSSLSSIKVDENDINPFEPTPIVAKDFCDEIDDASMASIDTVSNISSKMVDMSGFTFMDDLKQGKTLLQNLTRTFSTDFPDFAPVRKVSTARTA